MSVGLVVGKFYPPHLGHKLVIDTALAECDTVIVLVCATVGETIAPELRVLWLQQIHSSQAIVMAISSEGLGDDDTDAWVKATRLRIEPTWDVTDVYGSEDYVIPYAEGLGATPHMVDKERTRVPVSARFVRNKPYAWRSLLHPVVSAYYVPRIYVVGAESTGTTTLVEKLAEVMQLPWVPEFGRVYSKNRPDVPWRLEEFEAIARRQAAWEDEAALMLPEMLVCDTDPLATMLWCERYTGALSRELYDFVQWRQNAVHFSWYIITGDEIPFVQDGTRDGEGDVRRMMNDRFTEELQKIQSPVLYVRGSVEERVGQAVRWMAKT